MPEPPPVADPGCRRPRAAPGDGVTPNMTDAEAEAWAAQMEMEMAQEAAAPAAPATRGRPGRRRQPPPRCRVRRPRRRRSQPPPLGGAAGAVRPDRGRRCARPRQHRRPARRALAHLGGAGTNGHGGEGDPRIGPGTVIELTKLAGEPVDIYINGRLVAQGEVVVVDEHFGVRVTSLLTPSERVRSLA